MGVVVGVIEIFERLIEGALRLIFVRVVEIFLTKSEWG